LRRGLLLLPITVVVAALFNVFGQAPVSSTAAAPAAKLTVDAPVHGRSGLIYAARFRIDAFRSLTKATLILDSGWADGYTVNGLAPQPLTEGSKNGRLVLGFGHIPAGQQLTFWMSLQINPTNVGRHPQDVWLFDGSRAIAHVHRTIRVYP
jgi:FlaG/FlaF family flagellin (archaellin)